jgi:protein SCO1
MNTGPNATKPQLRASTKGPQIIFLLFGVILLGGLAFRNQLRGKGKRPPKMGRIADFQFLESSGKKVGLADLKGKVWVASFIFTRCSGPCARVSAAMAEIHRDKGLGDLQLVTFTVDPEFDTKNVLNAYAENVRVKKRDSFWYFLTGSKKDIHSLIFKSFRLPVEEAKPGSMPVGEQFAHSPRLVLIDRDGVIRGYYPSTDALKIRELKTAAAGLLLTPLPKKKAEGQ